MLVCFDVMMVNSFEYVAGAMIPLAVKTLVNRTIFK